MEIVREIVRGDKHNLRKSTIATHESVLWAEWTLICAWQFADFLRLCLAPRTTLRTISFSISYSFWY